MYVFELTIAAVAAVAWCYLLFARGGFWRVRTHLPSTPAVPQAAVRIAAIIPARNETDVVGRSVASLLAQSGGNALHVFLVDDASTDGTSHAARETAAECGSLDALTIISGRDLPPGWTGKLWAVHQGIEAATALNPEFLLLTDADILHAPDNVSTLIGIADSGGYDLTSFMVKLHCSSRAEKLLIPAFVYFFFKLYPPSWISNPRRATAGAAGGCMLVRPAALDRAGGIEAIRGEIIDDCALAHAVKRNGGKLWLGLTPHTSSLRPYGSFAEIGRMISRTAFNQLNHSTLLLLGTILGLMLVYVAPVALLFTGRMWPATLAALACLGMMLSYAPVVRFYGLNPLWTLALPTAALFYMGATVRSALDYWSGRGGQWKARAQDVGAVRQQD